MCVKDSVLEMDTIKIKLGARIKELRKANNLSQAKFAEMIGWDTSNLCNLEKGKTFLKPENIDKIANVLNVDVKELFNFEHFDDKNEIKIYLYKFISDATIEDIRFLYKIVNNLKEYNNKTVQ